MVRRLGASPVGAGLTPLLIAIVAGCSGVLTAPGPVDAGQDGDTASTDAGSRDATVPDAAAIDGGALDDGGPTGMDTGIPAMDAGPPPVDAGTTCVVVDLPGFRYEVTAAEESRMVPLMLRPGATYRSLTIELEVNPVDWNGTCWNPFRSPPANVAVHQSILELSKGTSTNWCHGGNLFWATARGPANNNYWVRSFYKERPDGRCRGTVSLEHTILAPARQRLTAGTFYPVRYSLDTTRGVIDMQLGSSSYSGPLDPRLVIDTLDPLFMVFSFNEHAECYDTSGAADPSAPCCWRPSTGWIYRNLRYTACE